MIAPGKRSRLPARWIGRLLPEDLELHPAQNYVVNAPMVDGVIPRYPGLKLHHLQAATISPVDSTIWFSSRVSNSAIQLDPKQMDPASRGLVTIAGARLAARFYRSNSL
jgi:hypothetical protein